MSAAEIHHISEAGGRRGRELRAMALTPYSLIDEIVLAEPSSRHAQNGSVPWTFTLIDGQEMPWSWPSELQSELFIERLLDGEGFEVIRPADDEQGQRDDVFLHQRPGVEVSLDLEAEGPTVAMDIDIGTGDHGVRRVMVDRQEAEDLSYLTDPGGWEVVRRERSLAMLRGTDSPLTEVSSTDQGESFAVPGGDAIFDEPDDIPALWGFDQEVLWAEGEPLMVCGSTGVGKTTLAQQLVLGMLGLRSEVLGMPVKQTEGRVLYLAMDRPRQALRSMRRMVSEADRAVLNDRLMVRKGPITDIGTDPTVLLQLARQCDASVVIVDSLKDATAKINDDESASNGNRAFQYCAAHGVEVMVLHHQRKAGRGEGKANKLDDVYGSRWWTAGMGSVVMLYGDQGAGVVDLTHLKMPAEPVGPWKVEVDYEAGTVSRHGGFDVLLYLANNAHSGVTVADTARLMFGTQTPTDAQRKRAKRKLDALVPDRARIEVGRTGGEGGSVPDRYYPIGALV